MPGDLCLELAVSTHYTHDYERLSEPLRQLRALINERRQLPHTGVGYWRYAMTMTGMVAEIVVKKF